MRVRTFRSRSFVPCPGLFSRVSESFQTIKNNQRKFQAFGKKMASDTSGDEEKKVDRLTKMEGLIESMQKEVSELKTTQGELSEKVARLSKFESQTRWKQAKRGIYPPARRDSTVVDEYVSVKAGGKKVKVKDPYRWMEDPDSDETKEWVNAQRALLDGYFDSECADRQKIYKRVESMINFERYSCPVIKGDRLFFRHNTGLQNQSLLFVNDSKEFSVESRRLLMDPNTLSEDGTTALKGTPKSFDGSLMAFAVSRSGSDWTEYQVMNVENGEVFPEVLKWTKFSSVAWTHDNRGFFYNRYATPKQFADEGDDEFKRGTETEKLTNQQLYWHRLGTEQSSDLFVVDSTMLGDSDWMMDVSVTHDGKQLLLNISNDCDPVNRVFLVELDQFDLSDDSKCDLTSVFTKNVRKLVDSFDYGYRYIHNVGDKYWFTTNQDAGLYRVVSADLTGVDNASEAKWAEVVAESEHRLNYTACYNGMLLLNYMEHAKDVLKLCDLDGKPVPGDNIMSSLPASSAAIMFSGTPYGETGFFRFESFCIPPQIYSYNYRTFEMKKVWEVSLPGMEEESLSDKYVTRQVFVESKDGTKVPMFVMHDAKLELSSNSPCVLYGYGGFDISLIPWFSAKRLAWLRCFDRAVYCVANLRGGGEYGEQWHKAGTKDRKQNVFDDFQACAEWLISNGYTRADKLAIEGGSNGGLLVGACANQRGTELYGAAVAHVGVMDMLRFHKFTIGYAWCSDYGNADEGGFDYLIEYSPLHNVRSHLEYSPYQYPALLACCADHDDRVVPLHSEKYVATVQSQLGRMAKQKNPLLIRIEGKAGHGGSSLTKSIELMTDSFAFMQAQLRAVFMD